MAQVKNTTKGDIGLTLGVAVPAGGAIEVDDEALAGYQKSKVVQAYFNAKWLDVVKANKAERSVKAKPEKPSKKDG